MKKKYFIYAILPFMVLAIVGVVYANSNTAGSNNLMNNLVNAIAQKFNLNVNDVQQVFDEQKAQMDVQREQKKEQEFTSRLSQAVADGKLTQEQANKISAKRAEIEAQKTSLESKTPEETRTAMKEQLNSLKQWATDNNIPQEYLFFGWFGMGRGHRGGPGFDGSISDHSCGGNASSSIQSE